MYMGGINLYLNKKIEYDIETFNKNVSIAELDRMETNSSSNMIIDKKGLSRSEITEII